MSQAETEIPRTGGVTISVDAMCRLTIGKQAIKTLQRMRARDARRVRGELDKLAQNPAGGTLT